MPQPFRSTYARSDQALASRALHPSIPIATPDGNAVLAQLERVLNSRSFAGAHRSQLFLRYIVEHALACPHEPPKEYTIALDVFGRGAYDPAVNNTVRVEAGRLRFRLLEYYASEGHTDPLLIEVPRGSYGVVMRPRQPAPTAVIRLPLTVVPTTSPRSAGALRAPHWAILTAFLLGAFFGYRFSR